MDTKQAAQDFLAKHTQLRELSGRISQYEQGYSFDDLGSAGMEVNGVLGEYNRLNAERGELVGELKRLRSEAGDENILSELESTEGSEAAREYIQKVPLQEKEEIREVRKEVKKGLFGRFR